MRRRKGEGSQKNLLRCLLHKWSLQRKQRPDEIREIAVDILYFSPVCVDGGRLAAGLSCNDFPSST